MASGFGQGAVFTGRYRLERVLGTGGMASVWLADDEQLGRSVAVKVLSDTLAHDESYLSRFHREARLAAGLSHPNLVKVYDFGGENERPYLVMEYVGGETLAGHIAGGTVLELDPDRLARELLGALDHIHSAGIVHRDVKPANVLIAPDGSAKLTDFGIAQPEDATRLTSTGLVIGTRNYMAPEVLQGDPATVRSDLYSCAMVLQEAFGDLLPAGLAPLVGHLGDEDPARRPESAASAMAHLEASGTPSSAGASDTAPTAPLPTDRTAPTIPIGATTSRFRPDRRVLGGLALLAALLVVGVLLLSGGDDSSSGGGRSSGVAGEGRGQQGQAPSAAAEEPAPTTTPTEKVPAEPEEPSEKAEKGKPSKPAKSPPGKAKGHKKD
jgi:eukaryotic-like serine/threonine-protein kinase